MQMCAGQCKDILKSVSAATLEYKHPFLFFFPETMFHKQKEMDVLCFFCFVLFFWAEQICGRELALPDEHARHRGFV